MKISLSRKKRKVKIWLPFTKEREGVERQETLSLNVAEISLLTAILLYPIVFYPFQLDPFTIPKDILLLFFTLISLISIIIYAYKKKIRFVFTPVQIGLTIFIITYLITSIFSYSPAISIIGDFPFFSPSLFEILTILSFSFILSNLIYIREEFTKKVATNFIIGSAIQIIFIIPLLLNIKIPYFSHIPTGSISGFFLFQVSTALLLLQRIEETDKRSKIALYLILFINLVVATLFSSLSLFIVIALGFLTLGVLFYKRGIKEINIFLKIFLIFDLVLMFYILKTIPSFKLWIQQKIKVPIEISALSFSDATTISVKSFTKDPITGSGPNTFKIVFSLYRPESLNKQQNWDIRYLHPPSSILETLATGGMIGIIGYLLMFFFAYLGYSQDSAFSPIIIITTAFLIVSHLSSTALYILVLSSTLSVSNKKLFRIPTAVGFPLLIATLSTFIIFLKIFIASYYANQTPISFLLPVRVATTDMKPPVEPPSLGDNYKILEAAIDQNPFCPEFHMAKATTSLLISERLSKTKNTNYSDIEVAQGEAVSSAQKAVELSRYDFLMWENLGRIYSAISVKNSNEFAIRSYMTAVSLNASDPIIYNNFGVILVRAGKIDDARNAFQKAVDLKSEFSIASKNLEAIKSVKKE
jgi:hypothetical protein